MNEMKEIFKKAKIKEGRAREKSRERLDVKRKRGLGEEPVAERREYELHEKRKMAYFLLI